MFPKPMRGEFRRERQERVEVRKAYESAEMRKAKLRDGFQCRRPKCPHCKNHAEQVDAAHRRDKHRAMGGNPRLDRTERKFIITLCRDSHDDYDNFLIDIDPQQEADYFDGCVDWYEKHPESGRMEQTWSEKRIGESIAVGL